MRTRTLSGLDLHARRHLAGLARLPRNDGIIYVASSGTFLTVGWTRHTTALARVVELRQVLPGNWQLIAHGPGSRAVEQFIHARLRPEAGLKFYRDTQGILEALAVGFVDFLNCRVPSEAFEVACVTLDRRVEVEVTRLVQLLEAWDPSQP